jgi:hypothetical protein
LAIASERVKTAVGIRAALDPRLTTQRGGVELAGAPILFLPVAPLFGVLSLAAADTVRVNCMVNEFTPNAAGLGFRLMVWSLDAIG